MESIVGKILCDRYRVIKELSHDDFSRVYLAEDLQQINKAKCQIERLQPQYDSEVLGVQSWQNVLQAFFDQGNVLKNISQHPRIPQLLAYFECEREFYLVREFINGVSLEQKLERLDSVEGSRSLIKEPEAINWLKEILEVLDFIHQAGIAHLNIQPSSLIQHQDGRKFLTNFSGIKNAVLFGNQLSKSIANQDFASPEQLQGKLDFTTDIYGLGKTIIYALTGNNTDFFESELLKSEDNGNLSDLSSLSTAKIRPELADILNKMVDENPGERYQNVADVLAELDFNHNIVTLPPPFFSRSQSSKTRSTRVKNSVNSQKVSSHSKFTQGILYSLFTLPFIIALGLIFIGINKNVYKEFRNYQSENYQFRIKYPQIWSYQELDDPITGGVVVFTSPLETDADLFLEKVYITVEYLYSESTTLEQYTQTVFERIDQEQGNEVEVHQDRKTKIGQYPARMVIYSRKEGGVQLRQMEAFTIKNNRVYIAIYTAERAKFSKFLDTAKKMISSWEIQDSGED